MKLLLLPDFTKIGLPKACQVYYVKNFNNKS